MEASTVAWKFSWVMSSQYDAPPAGAPPPPPARPVRLADRRHQQVA